MENAWVAEIWQGIKLLQCSRERANIWCNVWHCNFMFFLKSSKPSSRLKTNLLFLQGDAGHLCLLAVTVLSSPRSYLPLYFLLSQHCTVSHTLGLQNFHSETREIPIANKMNWSYSWSPTYNCQCQQKPKCYPRWCYVLQFSQLKKSHLSENLSQWITKVSRLHHYVIILRTSFTCPVT
jgi:hypothetical protein